MGAGSNNEDMLNNGMVIYKGRLIKRGGAEALDQTRIEAQGKPKCRLQGRLFLFWVSEAAAMTLISQLNLQFPK